MTMGLGKRPRDDEGPPGLLDFGVPGSRLRGNTRGWPFHSAPRPLPRDGTRPARGGCTRRSLRPECSLGNRSEIG